jgi:sugar-specific transcriptional regulator TrmB
MIKDILVKNGFSDKEAKVYLAILSMGELPYSQVATKTGIKRSTVYPIIESLEKKAVVTSIKKKGIKYASALNPQVLVNRFKQSAELAENMLPQLLDMAFESPLKPRIRFFDGLEGMKDILLELAHSKGDTMGFTDYTHMPTGLFKYIRKEVIPLRKEHKNFARLICPNTKKNQKIKKDDPGIYTEHRLLDFLSQKDLYIELLLFGGSKISISSFKEQEMFGFILDSQAAYDILSSLFEVMWQQSH